MEFILLNAGSQQNLLMHRNIKTQ